MWCLEKIDEEDMLAGFGNVWLRGSPRGKYIHVAAEPVASWPPKLLGLSEVENVTST